MKVSVVKIKVTGVKVNIPEVTISVTGVKGRVFEDKVMVMYVTEVKGYIQGL